MRASSFGRSYHSFLKRDGPLNNAYYSFGGKTVMGATSSMLSNYGNERE